MDTYEIFTILFVPSMITITVIGIVVTHFLSRK